MVCGWLWQRADDEAGAATGIARSVDAKIAVTVTATLLG